MEQSNTNTRKFNALADWSNDKQFVMSLAKGLELLRAFDPNLGPLSNSDIAEACGMPRPTVARMTYTLVKLGYLEFLPRLEKYRLGAGVLALGHSYLGTQYARSIAAPMLSELSRQHDLTAALAVRDRLDMVYIEIAYGRSLRAIRLDIGSRVPIARSAIGLAYLAGLDDNARAALMEELKRSDPISWDSTKALIDSACHQIKQDGFVTAKGLLDPNIAAAGAPVYSLLGTPVMAVNVSSPTAGPHADGIDRELCIDLSAVAQAISRSLARRGTDF